MFNFKEWRSELLFPILSAEDERRIQKFEATYNLPINEAELKSSKPNAIPDQMINLYQICDGFKITWLSDAKGTIGGQIHFIKYKQVIQDWKGNLFDDKDIEQNSLIEFFHPFDLITPEAQCGIMIGLEYEDPEIYFNPSPYPETEGLDIDLEGYLEMAKESSVFFYWPKVLLDIQRGEEGVETKTFKKYMPEIFLDFSWKRFVEKYESIRLSKR